MPEHEAETFAARDSFSSVTSSTAVAAVSANSNESSFPATIGRYRILRLLGEGGMGAVFEAEQDQPQRIVALKVIRAGYANSEMVRRFQNETEALGRLQHPGIAQIYDAGTAETPFGLQPYFAMELIRGQTLLLYCETHQLNPRQRLDLVAKIADAVQHAHQRGLIHRDLKPANILVDETGQPRILDFGVARLNDADAQATRQTDVGQLIGTLAYMSPEQVLGDPSEIDTRSDVYALGVVLYELLAGKFPYILSRQLPDAVRVIREQEPTQLSAVDRRYRGDVETIVAKALEKDKNRRYASAAELAADIRRYLHDEPIVARPPSTTYQLQKFARRNRALVVGIGAVFVVLVLGIVASSWEAVKARRAEKQAQQQSAVAQAVNDFLQNDLLGQASAYKQAKPDPNITVRTVLDRAAKNMQGKFNQQPAIEVETRNTVGNTYYLLGVYPEAHEQLLSALALSRRALGAEDPRTLRLMLDVANVDQVQGKYAEAERLSAQAMEIGRRVLGPEDPKTLWAMDSLARTYSLEGKYAQSETLLKHTYPLELRLLGMGSQQTRSAMESLARVYRFQGEYAASEEISERLVANDRRTFSPEDPNGFINTWSLASTYIWEGKFAQGEALATQLLAVERKVLGPESDMTLATMADLALAYQRQNDYARAVDLQQQTLEINRRTLGPENPSTLMAANDLAYTESLEGKYAMAEALQQQTLATQRRVLGPEHPDTLRSANNLAYTESLEGKTDRAIALQEQTLEIQRRVLGPDHPDTYRSVVNLAAAYQTQGDFGRAEELYRQLLEAPAANVSENYGVIANRFAWVLLTAPDHHARNPRQGLEMARRAVKRMPGNAGVLNTLGLAEVRNGLWEEAIGSLQEAIGLHHGEDADDFFFLALAKQSSGKKEDAARIFARGTELAAKDAANDAELRMVWAETAEAMGKPGPGPTLLEVKSDPEGSMERLKRAAAAGYLHPDTLQHSTDLMPLHGRPDFQALIRRLRSQSKRTVQ